MFPTLYLITGFFVNIALITGLFATGELGEEQLTKEHLFWVMVFSAMMCWAWPAFLGCTFIVGLFIAISMIMFPAWQWMLQKVKKM